MHKAQSDVQKFHEACSMPIGSLEDPMMRRRKLRAKLIREESGETVKAIKERDLIEAIDGMIDTLFVIYGTAVEWGIDLEPFWDEVQRTNMAKAGGPMRKDGKQLKPEGWQPPDIKRVLYEQIGHKADEHIQSSSGWDA